MTAISACKQEKKISGDKEKITFSIDETVIPQDTTMLWVADGNPSKDTVAILLQGGPKDELSFISQRKTQWRYLPNYDEFYRVHLHQANTLNPGMFYSDGKFTMEMARKEIDHTSEMVYRVIKYFKDRKKTVYVMGHSYGAFVIPHYLATRPALADKYVMASGRISDPQNVVAVHAKGFNGTYQEGSIFLTDEGTKDFTDYDEASLKYYTRKQLLKAAIGEPSYTEELKDVDLTNSIYVYNSKDKRVGGLTEQELEFLRSKGFQIYETDHSHGNTIYGLVDAIEQGNVKL